MALTKADAQLVANTLLNTKLAAFTGSGDHTVAWYIQRIHQVVTTTQSSGLSLDELAKAIVKAEKA